MILKAQCTQCGVKLRVSASEFFRERGWLLVDPPLQLPDIVFGAICPRCLEAHQSGGTLEPPVRREE